MADPRFILPADRIQHVASVVGRIFELGRGFKVHPPREVTDDPAITQSDRIVEKLADTKWWLKFADGREELLAMHCRAMRS